MRFVNHRVLPRHVADLDARLAAVLPEPLTVAQNSRNAHRRRPEGRRVSALQALADLAEAEGWLDPTEAIAIRKLAYRVSFYLERARTQP